MEDYTTELTTKDLTVVAVMSATIVIELILFFTNRHTSTITFASMVVVVIAISLIINQRLLGFDEKFWIIAIITLMVSIPQVVLHSDWLSRKDRMLSYTLNLAECTVTDKNKNTVTLLCKRYPTEIGRNQKTVILPAWRYDRILSLRKEEEQKMREAKDSTIPIILK